MSFSAFQAEFAGFPESTVSAESSGNLVDIYMRLADEKGGLIPQAMMADVLGVSTARVSQLISDHRFEVHQLGKMKFITGDSLAAYYADEKKHGRGHKAPRFMTVLRATKRMMAGMREEAA